MTITYPRDLPDLPFKAVSVEFNREPLGTFSRAASGRTMFQEQIGGGLWQAKYTTKPLKESDYGRWHAWKLSLRGASKTFKGYDPRRCFPIRYGDAVLTMPGSGTCRITAAGGETIAIDQLPAGFVLTEGDYLSFDWLGSRQLVKALETVTANGSGVIASVAIDPWLRAGGTAMVGATMVRAWCEMKIVPGSWSAQRSVIDPVSFDAIQHVN